MNTRWVALLTTVMLLVLPARAGVHPNGAPHVAVHQWNSKDGMPQNSVHDIVALSDGRMLIATSGGLAFFDDHEFMRLDLEARNAFRTSRFARLRTGPDELLLAATEDGQLLRLQGKAAGYVQLEQPGPSSVNDLVVDARGGAWFATSRGLHRIEPDAVKGELLGVRTYASLALDRDERLFAAAGSEGLWVLEAGSLQRVLDEPVRELAATADGTVWALAGDRLLRFAGTQVAEAITLDVAVSDIAPDPERGLYLLGPRALHYFGESGRLWTLGEVDLRLSREDRLLSILVTPGGKVWLGCSSSGLRFVSPSPLGMLAVQDEGPAYIYSVLFTREGELIALGAEVFRRVGDHLESLGLGRQQLIAAAREGGFWYSNRSELFHWQAGQSRKVLTFGSEADRPQQMLELRDGRIALVSPSHLQLFDGQELETFELPDAGTSRNITSVFQDGRGRLWIGGSQNLHCFDGRDFTSFWSGKEIPYGAVRSFVERGDTLWIGTYGSGILRIDERVVPPRVSTIGTHNGLREAVASALVSLDDELLVVHNSVVSVYAWDTLERIADGQEFHVFGRSYDAGPGIDIFESNAQLTPRFAFDASGTLHFPALNGLAWFDPDMNLPVIAPVRTSVRYQYEGLEDDGRSARIEPKSGERSVRFDFHAPTYVYPRQTLYRYRLAGLEEGWSYSRAPLVVAYSDLAPGEYQFEVQAAVAGGAFGPLNLRRTLHIPRMWFELPAVRITALALLGLTLLGLGYLRTREVHRRNQLMERTVAERTVQLREEVTERKRIEMELRKASEHLESQVRTRTAELARALTNLEWDIHRRENLEGRLREAEKLEAIGRLAGGLAHDFNNILTAIMGEVDLTRLELDMRAVEGELAEAIRGHVGNIRNAGERAAGLTRQLLAYSRQQVLQPKVVSPLKTLRGLQPMLDRLVPESVELFIDPHSSQATVLIDPSQLEQIVVNLFVNAAEAMPSGGRIDASVVESKRPMGEDFVELIVRDTGPGFSPEHRPHVFEPFYSAKGPARGLGLASVHGIVHQSKGTIELESELGHGATFRIAFPRVDADEWVAERPETGDLPLELSILLVDDESEVRRVARMMLERMGYDVRDTADPEEALAWLRDAPQAFDLLITDVVMPRLNGKQLAMQARLANPDLNVLFISGYSTDVLGERDLEIDTGHLLPKPFDRDALCIRIAQVLATRSQI